MQVSREDYSYATVGYGGPIAYGEAIDCYTRQPDVCGPKSTFVINTSGTGLIVDKTVGFNIIC